MPLIKNSFKNKLILLIAFFQLALISILGFFFTKDIIKREQKKISIENINTSNEVITDIDNRISLFIKDIELLASLPAIESYDKNRSDAILKNTTVSSMFLSNEKILGYDNKNRLFSDNTIFGSSSDSILDDSTLFNSITPLSPYISGIIDDESNYSHVKIGVYIQNRSIGYGHLVAKFSLQRLSDIVKKGDNLSIVLFDKNGNFIAKNSNSLSKSTIMDFDISKEVFDKTISSELTIKDQKYYYASNYNKRIGFGVIVLEPDSNIQHTINRLKMITIFGLIGTFFISFLFSFILSTKLIKPLKNLTEKILAIKDGNLNISTKIEKSDEIGELANSFDNMRLNLKESFKKLNLFISDLKMINSSSTSIMTSNSIDDLILSDLEKIQSVFKADIVIINILLLNNDHTHNYVSNTNNIDLSSYDIDKIYDQSELIHTEKESIIATPITLNNEVIGSIYISRYKSNYFDDNRIETAEILATQIAVGIESLRLYDEEKDKLLIEHDLQNAKIIQNAIYPIQPLDDLNTSINYYYESADDLSGDWLQFYNSSQTELLFLVGDVTGHGVGASLLTSTVHTFFTTYSKNLIPTITNDLPKATETLNDIICSSPNHLNMTLLLAKFNFEKMIVEICNAGHNNAILFREINDEIKIITLINLNTRIGEDAQIFSSTNYPIEHGDKILFYTDGIIEWQDERGREWGKKSLVKFVQRNLKKDNQLIIEGIIGQLDKKMINRTKMDDDLTLAVLTVK